MGDRPEKGLAEKRAKILDHVFNNISETQKKWDNRPTHDDTRFIERYERGDCHVAVVFRIAGEPREYVAVFVKASAAIEDVASNATQFITGGHFLSGCRREQDIVLVSVVELLEDDERGSPCPSLVWVQPLNRFTNGIVFAAYLSTTLGVEVLGRPAYRKTSVAAGDEVGRSIASVMADKVTRQDVECGAEIVQAVSDDARHLGRDGREAEWWKGEDGYPAPFPFLVSLSGETARARQTPCLVDQLEIVKVLFGPCNLGRWAGRWVAHD